jgi:hypothetical protein
MAYLLSFSDFPFPVRGKEYCHRDGYIQGYLFETEKPKNLKRKTHKYVYMHKKGGPL